MGAVPKRRLAVGVAVCVAVALSLGAGWLDVSIPSTKVAGARPASPTPLDGAATIPGWTNGTGGFTETDEGPPAETGAASAYFPEFTAWTVFGGRDSNGTARNDTWMFIGGEREWDSLASFHAGQSFGNPPPLADSELVYDAADGYLLLFGGTFANGSASSETWTFTGPDWNHLAWTYVAPHAGVSPPATGAPRMAYDSASGRVLLYTDNSAATWWTYRAGVWSPVNFTGPPPMRSSPVLADDPALGGVVLFGGSTPGGNLSGPEYLTDTWVLQGTIWSAFARGPSPPPLRAVEGTLDPTDGYLLVVGDAGPALVTWGLVGGSWTNLSGIGGAAPPARSGETIGYEPVDPAVLMFGGSTSRTGTASDELWVWNLPVSVTGNPLAAAPLPPLVWETAAAVGVVPVAIALLYYRRPPRRLPTSTPAPSTAVPA